MTTRDWRLGEWKWNGEGPDPLGCEIEAAEAEAVRRLDLLHLTRFLGNGMVDQRAFAELDVILDEMDELHRQAWEGSGRTEMDVRRVGHHAARAMFDRLWVLARCSQVGNA